MGGDVPGTKGVKYTDVVTLGAGGESGILGTGIMSSGPQKLKGYSMDEALKQAEKDAVMRQADIASGKSPSIAQSQLNMANDQATRQALAMAASQRGASNPALAFRQAQVGNQQMSLENAQAGAIMAEQERRAADQYIAQQAASQRGTAFQQDQFNIDARLRNQQQNAAFISGVGSTAAKAASGGAG